MTTDTHGGRQPTTGSLPPTSEVLVVGPAGYDKDGTGGISRYIAEQTRRLEGRVAIEVVDTSVKVPDGPAGYLRAVLTILAGWFGLPFRHRPDVVHVHTSHHLSFYISTPYVLFAAIAWRRPVILHVHGSGFDDFIDDASAPVAALQRLVFDATTVVVALSEYWRDVLSTRVPTRKIVVLPNAVDPAEYVPDPGADPPHLVFVSNHVERKGIVETTQAIERLQADGVPFRATLAGAGPKSGHASELAETHDAVEYVGFISEARKRDLLSAGSVYVLPTYAEGLPIAVLEAMAGANAIVSTDVGAIPSIVDADNGVVVPPGDVDALTAALRQVLTDPSTVERMGQVSRSRIESGYAWDDVGEDLLALYARVLANEATSAADATSAVAE